MTTDLERDCKRVARKRDRREGLLREAQEEVDDLLLRAAKEGRVADAARAFGFTREHAWLRLRKIKERRAHR